MRALLFSLLKIVKRIGALFWGKGLGRILGVGIFYRVWCSFFDLAYDKAKPKGIILMDVQGNKMYVNTDDRGIAPMLLIDGIMEKYETELFKKMVKEGMVVVDIGANIGYYTLIAAKLVGKHGTVYAFEPEPTTYELLCKNINLNGYTNVVTIQKAVSTQHGKLELWVDKAGQAISSFSKENVLAFSKDKVLGKVNSIEVETIALDEFFDNIAKNNKVDIIKIDTQGAEGLIIDGGQRILKSNSLKVLMEFWPGGLRNVGTDPIELLHKLQEYEFKIERINERQQVLEPVGSIEDFCRKAKLGEEFNLLLEK